MKRIFILTALILFYYQTTYSKDFQFAWFTDTHIAQSGTAVEDLRAVVKDVNSRDSISFVLVTGDITDLNINDDLLLAKRILDSLTMPYYIIPGNHDTKWSDTGNQNFKDFWGDDKFVFDYEKYKFIGLHQGPVLHMTDGHISPKDLRWLNILLKNMEDQKQPIIFVTHYAVDQSIDNYDRFLDIIKPYNVKMILHGHGHRNRAANYCGIPGIMSRSTLRAGQKSSGYTLTKITDETAYFSERLSSGADLGIWHKQSLEQTYTVQDSLIRRPDYSVNNEFPNVQVKWKFKTRNMITGSPAVYDRGVFIADDDGLIYAVDLNNGEELWRFSCPAAVYAAGAAADGRAVFPCLDGTIYCLNTKDGSLLWKFKTDKAVQAIPAIENGTVYIGGSDHRFRAIDLKSGKLTWEFNGVKGYVQSKPLIYKGKVIFGAWDQTIYALNKTDGSLSWKWSDVRPHDLYSPAACHPVGAYNKVFAATPDRFLNAINAETGKTIWRSNKYKVRESAGISEDSSRIYAKCMNDTIFAVTAEAEKPEYVWIKNFNYGYDHTPSMIMEKDGTAFVSVRGGMLFSFDGQSGALKWKHKYGNTFINTVLPLGRSSVLITNMDGDAALIKNEED